MLANSNLGNQASENSRARELFRMTWPMLIGVLSLMSFQLADSIYIARLGIEPLAIIGFTIPIYQIVIGFQVGIGIATTALISQLLGAKEEQEAHDLGGTILLVGTLIITVLCAVIWFFRAQILSLLGGEVRLLPLFSEFWAVWLVSAFCGAVLYFGYSICRAHGNTLLPGLGMILTSLLNIGLDPLFIFYFDLGLVGAAYASILSFAAGLVLVFPKVWSMKWLSFHASRLQLLDRCRKILNIATPAMLSQMLPSLAAMIATNVVAGYGTEAVAAWGLGVRFEFFSIIVILALTMSLPPMVGRLYGARDFEEINGLIKLAFKVTLCWQVFLALALALLATSFSQFMAGTPEVAAILNDFLVFIPISYALLGICMLSTSISNAIGQPSRALAISFCRLFVCFVPGILIGAHLGDLFGLIIGASVGNVAAGLLAWQLHRQGIKKASMI